MPTADTHCDNGSQDVAFDEGDPLNEARRCYQQGASGARDSVIAVDVPDPVAVVSSSSDDDL